MIIRSQNLIGCVLTGLTLAGCASSPPGAFPSMAAAPSMEPGEAFSKLIGPSAAVTDDELEVRELLRRNTEVPFPARLGTMYFNYEPPLEEVEKINRMNQFGQDMLASGLIKSAALVPGILGRGLSLEGLRKLAARLQVDILLLINGTSDFRRSETQPGGWFSAFSHAANYEAQTSLLAFCLDVYSGTLLPPNSALGRTVSTLLDPTLPNFLPEQRRLKAEAFGIAADNLKDTFIETLKQLQANQRDTAPSTATPPVPAQNPAVSP